MYSKPKILVDARMVSKYEHGISRYVTDIADVLLRVGLEDLPYEPVFILSKDLSGSLPEVWRPHSVDFSPVEFLSIFDSFEFRRLIKKHSADAVHSPSFASFPGLGVPYMQTVHDLIHLHYGSGFHRAYYRFALKSFARKAKVLATVSGAARDEIASWLHRSTATINIHYNAFDMPVVNLNDLNSERQWLKSIGLMPGHYFLSVANDKPHKNLQPIRDAYGSSREMPLVIAHEILGKFDPDRKVTYGFTALIRNAAAVISPSLLEGFGRVPIEAILFGTPTFLSSIPAHKEILEGLPERSFRFLDPLEPKLWANAMRCFSEFPLEKPSDEIKQKILNRFSMRKFGEEINASYCKLIDGLSNR